MQARTLEDMMKTDVAIIGAGPAGLLLAVALNKAGVSCAVIERQTQSHVEGRIRAGLLEDNTANFLDSLGVGSRMRSEGLIDRGINLADGERLIRIDFHALTGRSMLFYGQTEITKDLILAASDRGVPIIWEAQDVELNAIESRHPSISYRIGDRDHRLEARFIAGCDGFRGPSRDALCSGRTAAFEKVYPFGWLGILSDVPPCHPENIYVNHERGFALATLRSHSRSRYYIQVPLTDGLDDWPNERLWDEIELRLGTLPSRPVVRGPALEKSIAPLRSFVVEPMQRGSLFLAGDAAHIVPPTGAKGLNLAASDVRQLSEALIDWFVMGNEAGLASYSERALQRVWQAERFSWYLSNLLHRFPDTDSFERRMQIAELDHIASSQAMQIAIAENYVGLVV